MARGFCGVNGVGQILGSRGWCLWVHIMVITNREDWRSSRLCEEQGVRLSRGLMGGNGIVCSEIHGAGLDSVCSRGWKW